MYEHLAVLWEELTDNSELLRRRWRGDGVAGVAAPGAPAPLTEGVGGAGGGAGGDQVLGDQGAPVAGVMDVRL